MPELVRQDGLDGPNGQIMKVVYDREIMAVMVKAIQELNSQIVELKAKVA
jgi:hypothetical protein